MKYCPKCGAEQSENSKFCTKCGNKVTAKKIEKVAATGNVKRSKKWLINSVYIILAVICFAYIYKTFIGPKITPESIANPLTIEEMTGIWHDPTGVLLGSPEALITMQSSDGSLFGQDDDQKISIELRLQGKNKLTGHVTLHGLKTTADAEFDRESNKLIFTNKLSGLDWYIKKK